MSPYRYRVVLRVICEDNVNNFTLYLGNSKDDAYNALYGVECITSEGEIILSKGIIYNNIRFYSDGYLSLYDIPRGEIIYSKKIEKVE